MNFEENYNNELEHLEEIRQAWQKDYDKMGVTLTIADAKEIRDNLCNLAKLLWQWEKNAKKEKEQEEQEKI